MSSTPTPAARLSSLSATPFWQLLRPQDVVAEIWLLITLPVCFVDVAALWMPLVTRVFLIPGYLFVRPYSDRYAAALEADEASGYPTSRQRRLWSLFLRAVATFIPWLVYPLGYNEMGKFIAVVHNDPGCANDWGVQSFEETVFNGQPCLTWRGRSHNAAVLLFDEYLQFCYFMLYLCVAGIPFGFWLIGYFATRHNNGSNSIGTGSHNNNGVSSLSGDISSAGVTPSVASDGIHSDEPTTPSSLPSDSPMRSDSSIPSSPRGDVSSSVILATPRGPAMFTPMIPIGNGFIAKQRAKLLRDPWYGFDVCLVALLVASYSCWVIYFIHPVSGPLWCFQRPDSADTGYFFSYVNAKVQDNGAAHGTATPSSHCASTVCLWILCMIFNRHMAITGAFFVPGLVWATFYLQYHYLIDAIAGTIMGIILPFLAIKITDALRGFLHGPQWSIGAAPKGSAAALASDDEYIGDDIDGIGNNNEHTAPATTMIGTGVRSSGAAADAQSLLEDHNRSEDDIRIDTH